MDLKTKIYPTAEELKTINSCLHCPEEDCSSIFTSESNLNLHLIKTHKKDPKPVNTASEYYCPQSDCIYHIQKSFKNHKLLKQHYLKVHAEKAFVCEICKAGFSTQSSKNRHARYCGINFKCCNCKASYSCYETLLTHCRRKGHKILDKTVYNPSLQVAIPSKSDIKMFKKDQILLPKTSTSLQLIKIVPVLIKTVSSSTFEKGSQTEVNVDLPKLKTKQTQVNRETLNCEHSSKHSQTLDLRRTSSSIETQTIGDYVSKKPKLTYSEINTTNLKESIDLKSIKTQTKPICSTTKSCNTSFTLDESEYISNSTANKSSSSTQTTATVPIEPLYSISTATHDSIHTDTSDLNFEFMHSSSQTCLGDDIPIFDSVTDSDFFFNCNIETQTDLMFDVDFLNYEDSYSTTQTQTIDSLPVLKDDIGLGNYYEKTYDMLLNTIHTQTAFDDVCRSVESQTLMSHNSKFIPLACKDMANMETQTEVDFKMLLEEINS